MGRQSRILPYWLLFNKLSNRGVRRRCVVANTLLEYVFPGRPTGHAGAFQRMVSRSSIDGYSQRVQWTDKLPDIHFVRNIYQLDIAFVHHRKRLLSSRPIYHQGWRLHRHTSRRGSPLSLFFDRLEITITSLDLVTSTGL